MGLVAFLNELRKSLAKSVSAKECDCHINDLKFSDTAMAIFIGWVASGIVPAG